MKDPGTLASIALEANLTGCTKDYAHCNFTGFLQFCAKHHLGDAATLASSTLRHPPSTRARAHNASNLLGGGGRAVWA